MDLELGAFQFGNLGLNTKLAGKEKKSGPISQLLAYLLNLVCAGAKCSNPTSPETWAFVSFGDVIRHKPLSFAGSSELPKSFGINFNDPPTKH